MGYLDNSSVTIDAILTAKGRELLAKGAGNFDITKFALGDDEIDYTLWNENHPLGTAYYGTIIENMPILEAVPDETQALRSRLITLAQNATNIPNIGGLPDGFVKTFASATERYSLSPVTGPTTAFVDTSYTVTISDSSLLRLSVGGSGAKLSETLAAQGQGSARSITGIGLTFEITCIPRSTIQYATITVTGNTTGASASVRAIIPKL
jgi:hypothetical protein